jgi:ribonuclease P/MRP protein subunit RPP40
MYHDVQKALDSVSHDILLDTMFMYGERNVVHNWFKSYLHRRQQYVLVNNVCSDVRRPKYGVFQGSVLGPLLFLIYVNDIGNALPDAMIKLVADDTNTLIFSDDTVGALV